jgi:hypothetical protein
MRALVIISIIALSINIAFAEEILIQLPKDVSDFIEKRDLCDHFRGEDPYDDERRVFLEENISKFCTGTDLELLKLKDKYIKNQSIMDVLNHYEEKIEASSLIPNN